MDKTQIKLPDRFPDHTFVAKVRFWSEQRNTLDIECGMSDEFGSALLFLLTNSCKDDGPTMSEEQLQAVKTLSDGFYA